MKRSSIKSVLLSVAVWVSCTMSATPVTQQQALDQAKAFLSARGLAVERDSSGKARMASATAPDDAAYYIFNAEGGGFVVISGDDLTAPVLGYCDQGVYDAGQPDMLPEGMQWLLQMYEDQIRNIRASESVMTRMPSQNGSSQSIPVRHHIEPLLTTLWNQGHPYNLLCPQYYNQDGSLGDRCATGCVATAIAQVMAYYRYPHATTRTIPGYVQHFATSQGDKSVQLRNVPSNSVIDWDNMVDEYDGDETESQQQAVAQLMYWVGLGCRMGYGPSSAAGFPDAVNALKRYFGYDDGTHIESRYQHTLQSWTDLLYNELATGHPVAFAGTNSGGAHAFVLDGYDVEGLFHVNWGWGGMDNGYFRIDVLDPDDNTGIGSSPAPGGYNMGQDAIIGMRLPDDLEAQTDGYKLTVNDWEIRNGNTFFANYVNWSGIDADWNVGIGRVDDDGSIVLLGSAQTVHLNQNYYHSAEFVVRGLEEGTYRIIPVSKRASDQQWQTHVNPDISYVEAVVDADRQVSLVIHPIENVEVTGISFPGNHKKGQSQQVSASFRNHGEEYYHEVFLFAGRNNVMGQSICRTAVSICIDGETTASLSFTPEEAGTWNVWLTSDHDGKQIMAQSSVDITEEGVMSTDHLRFVSVTVSNRSNGVIYGNCMQGKVSILNQGGEDFDGKVSLWLFKLADNGLYYGQSKIEVPFHADAQKMGQATFFFDHLQMNADYSLSVGYVTGGDITDGGLKPIGRTQNGILCWLSDNTLKGMPPSSFVNTPANALAMDLSGLDHFSGTLHPNNNPNTLYFFHPDITLPEGLDDANVVRGNHADRIHLQEGWGFMSPMPFTADEVSYQCEPTLGKWQTIALPFSPKSLPDGLHVLEFSALDDEEKPVFSTTAIIQRNIPYLIFTNQCAELMLSATDARISATYQAPMAAGAGEYLFRGTTIGEKQSGIMVMNEEGNAFVRSSEQMVVNPFQGYFRAPADVETISIPDVIDNGVADHVTNVVEDSSWYYNLNGQRMDKPRKGIYIHHHQKVVVR